MISFKRVQNSMCLLPSNAVTKKLSLYGYKDTQLHFYKTLAQQSKIIFNQLGCLVNHVNI